MTFDTFDPAFQTYRHEIGYLAYTQRVPGMDPDDIGAEMATCLWRAWQTYTPGSGDFGTYWWSCWLNRRRDLWAAAVAIKRPVLIPVEDKYLDTPVYDVAGILPPPPGTTDLGHVIWGLIARGETVVRIRQTLRISRRTYYDTLTAWKTPAVRQYLKEHS